MISWRSYTTSKLPPTFVGQEETTESWTRSNANEFRTETASESYKATPTGSTRAGDQGGTQNLYSENEDGDRVVIGQDEYNLGGPYNHTTTVNKNTTFYWNRDPFSLPLQTVKQETTTEIPFTRQIRTTSTISAYEGFEGQQIPIEGYVWTLSTYETNRNGENTTLTTVSQITTETTLTVAGGKEVPSSYLGTTTFQEQQFSTYDAPDGNVRVVAHTIYKPTALRGFGLNGSTWESAVSMQQSGSDLITNLSLITEQFTVSYIATSESLPARADSDSTTAITTLQTLSENHATTTVGRSNETYPVWFLEINTRTCEERTGFTVYTEQDEEGEVLEYTVYDAVSQNTLQSFENNSVITFEEPTIVNTTTSTFETYVGKPTKTVTETGYTTKIAGNDDADDEELTKSFYVQNTSSTETTTSYLSGFFLTTKTQSVLAFVDNQVFPYTSFSETNREIVNTTNADTEIVTSTSVTVSFGHSYSISFRSKSTNWQAKKIGQFYKTGQARFTAINDPYLNFVNFQIRREGVDDPNLNFDPPYGKTAFPRLLTANAQHTFGNPFNNFARDHFIDRGSFFPQFVGAIPLTPTFTGIASVGPDGWELCNSSEFTSITGRREGASFTTTAAAKSKDGTSTVVETSTGTFTAGTESNYPLILGDPLFTIGGKMTPNASVTALFYPGAYLITTYSKGQSGTSSTLYSEIFTSAFEAGEEVSRYQKISRVAGFGVKEMLLADFGDP